MRASRMPFTFVFLISILSCSNNAGFEVTPVSQALEQKAEFNTKVDILFVIDNSDSMLSKQNKLLSEVDDFFMALKNTGLDFRIASVTTDMRKNLSYPAYLKAQGRIVGEPKVIDQNSENYELALEKMIQLGNDGSSVEQGLAAMRMALSPEMLSGENQNFLREDAMLALIFLSDEDDMSSGEVEEYMNFLNDLKPNFESGNSAWVANFLGVTDLNSECLSNPEYNFADPGLRYMELVTASEGESFSICKASLSEGLTNVRKRIMSYLTDFVLAYEVYEESIEVRVDGEVILNDKQNGWSFEASRNTLRFHGTAIPSLNSEIIIFYRRRI